jgi:G3E family GTPase
MNDKSNSKSKIVLQKTGFCRVYIISGFLGSGKTTLLKHLLDWEIDQGRRPYVIMSEFGDMDIDGVLISDRRIELTSIVGGCVCCDLRDELAMTLREITQKEADSTVFIESTGIANPAGIMIAIAPIIKSGAAEIRNVISVYDAYRDPLKGKYPNLVKDQLITADTILINKADLVPAQKIQEIKMNISEVNDGAELLITSQCKVEPEYILKKTSSVKMPAGAAPTSTIFRSYGFRINSPLSREALEKWLKTLPPSVARVKGFVRLHDQNGFFEVQSVYGKSSITPFNHSEDPPLVLVLITRPIRIDGLVRRLQSCLMEGKNQGV